MRGRIVFFALCSFVMWHACTDSNGDGLKFDSRSEWIAWLEATAEQMADAKSMKIDTALALQYVAQASAFAEKYPQDSMSALLLFRAADVARGVGEYGKAIQLWGQVWRTYPDFKLAPDALFLQAFTFDNDLKDVEEARKYYQKVIAHFPNHPLTGQAEQLLKVLGKSPEELVRKFQQQQSPDGGR